MHQHDVAVFYMTKNCIHALLGIPGLPVQGINAPQNDRCIHIGYYSGILASTWQTDSGCSFAGSVRDGLIALLDLFPDLCRI